MKLPLARVTDIIVQPSGEELLIFDRNTNKAHSLNPTAKIVYQNCDGKTSFEDLKRKHQFTDEVIYLALDQLATGNLIEAADYSSPFEGMERRDVIRKVGLSAMIALPVVSSLIAPKSANAQSCLISGTPIDVSPQLTGLGCLNALSVFAGANCCSGGHAGAVYNAGTQVCTATCS